MARAQGPGRVDERAKLKADYNAKIDMVMKNIMKTDKMKTASDKVRNRIAASGGSKKGDKAYNSEMMSLYIMPGVKAAMKELKGI